MDRYSLSLAILFPTPLQITEVVFPYQPTGVILLCSTKRDISFLNAEFTMDFFSGDLS